MNMSKRNITIVILAVISVGIIFFIADDLWTSAMRIKNHPNTKTPLEKIRVATSSYPIYFFAQQIGKDRANIFNITPTQANPQFYKLTTKDIESLEKSNLIILNGLGFESWLNDATEINESVYIASSTLSEDQVIQIAEAKINPYIWLSPILAKQMVDKISESFIEKDSENRNYYLSNTDKLKTELDNLDEEYKSGLINCQDKNVVVLDPTFNYLIKAYGLNQILLSGLVVNAELTDQQIKNVKDFVKEQNIKYIFVESAPYSVWQKNIEEKLSVKIILLDIIDKYSPTENYFSRMRKNLANLKIGLQCQ